jgi:hypothetical protein
MASATEAPANAEGLTSHTLNQPYTPEQQRDMLAALRAPFPADVIEVRPGVDCGACEASTQIGVCKQHHLVVCKTCGQTITEAHTDLSYVGHADITDRLLEVDPLWNWEPLAEDSRGLPLLDEHGGMWIRLTVAGVTRRGYGDAGGKTPGTTATKEIIGDALRNAGMRFGMALELWARRPGRDDEARDYTAGRLEELARWARFCWNSPQDLAAIRGSAVDEGFAEAPAPRGDGTFVDFLDQRLAYMDRHTAGTTTGKPSAPETPGRPQAAAGEEPQQDPNRPAPDPEPDPPHADEPGEDAVLDQMVDRVRQDWGDAAALDKDLAELRRLGLQDRATETPPEWGGKWVRFEDMVGARLDELASTAQEQAA